MQSKLTVMLVAAMAALLAGCDQQEIVQEQPKSVQDDLRADEILGAIVEQYSGASSYKDSAVLYLSYRLDGRAIQEPHPWSVAWDRGGRFAADLFNAKIRCDSTKLSCYVFDIESGNIDNQHLLVDAAKFEALLNDPIASHFISGLVNYRFTKKRLPSPTSLFHK